MELTITEKAAVELKKAMDSQEAAPAALRLGVMEGGCCGAKYTLSLAESREADETVAESQGIKVYVPSSSKGTLMGTVIDFVTTPSGSGFHVSQPSQAAEGHEHGHSHGHGHGGGGCACGGQGACGSGEGGCGC